MKSEIIEQLGQTELMLPAILGRGLAANDRVKVRLSVLQAAARHARDPSGPQFNLADECHAVGIDPGPMEALVNRSSLPSGGRVAAPGLGSLERAIWDDVAVMTDAVAAGDAAAGEASQSRLSMIKAAAGNGTSDEIDLGRIAKFTALGESGDSLHRLIMDLHKTLNRLSAGNAEEILAGAHVHGLLAQDRPLVEAFMRGVESTRKLKFGHPGLDTTAARTSAGLTIQNDIGETDAHVVVVIVEPSAVTVTYTDIHLPRAKFFAGLFPKFDIQWSGFERQNSAGLGEDGAFYLITGRFPCADDALRASLLEALGASLVFLIDWNKARKVLRALVPRSDAIRILEWGARHRFGHRGFLELGGSELIASVVRRAAPTRIGFGERLDQALGRDAAVDFLKSVLRISAEALLAGGSVRLARDRIEAELARHLQRVEAGLFKVLVRQAGLAREIATGIAGFIAAHRAERPFDRAGLAAQARHIEEKADRIAVEARSEVARFGADRAIERLVNRLEDAIDELEQAAFVATLVPNRIPETLAETLGMLCAAAVSAAEAAATAASAAADIPENHRVDSEDALAAVGRLVEAEHSADAAERSVTTIVLQGEFELKCALSVLELSRALERATDRLAGFGHLLREYVIADLAA